MADKQSWPLGGYAPGDYNGLCLRCGETFEGDKRAITCLPCAVTVAKLQAFELKRLQDMPQWKQGAPTRTDRLYLAWSDSPERRISGLSESLVSLYAWTPEGFQHFTGWYDHAVTHWMITDVPSTPMEAPVGPPN